MTNQTPADHLTLPPPQGPEYEPCSVCGHIEPEHQPDAGACQECGCGAYRPAVPAVTRSEGDQ